MIKGQSIRKTQIWVLINIYFFPRIYKSKTDRIGKTEILIPISVIGEMIREKINKEIEDFNNTVH